MNTEEENIEYTRIMIVMERSFQDFDEQCRAEFLNDLSTIAGCLKEDFQRVYFRSGCVIFEAKIQQEAVERILELWEIIQEKKNSNIETIIEVNADDLKDLEKFIKKYTISRIKGNIEIPFPIVENGNDHESESKAIVFVHGWRGDENSFGQLPEFLCECGELNCSNEIYSYPSSWTEGKSIVFISRNLDNWIRHKRKKNGYQKLAFVAHSMGGLVVKKFLINQVCRDKPVTGYVKEITFIATPHNGAVLAKLPGLIPGLKTSQVSELSAGSPFLVELNDQWSAWTRLFVPDFCRYGSIFGTDDEVVDPTNAPGKDLETVYILGAKHVNIVKPESPDDEVVATVIDFLQEANF